MKTLTLLVLVLSLSACAGIKVTKGEQRPYNQQSKPGITSGGSWISGGGLDKGFWCDVKGGMLTFGQSGPTEAKATELAKVQCQKMVKDSPCELVACKRN